MRGVVGVVALVLLAGCSSGSPSPAATVTVTASSSSSSSSTSSAGDLAACTAYARVAPVAVRDIKDIGSEPMPTDLMVSAFKRSGDQLEAGTVAATDPVLVEAFKGTVAGFRSAQATAAAWTSGDLNLLPDLRVIYQQSQLAAQACKVLDPSGDYPAIVNAG